MIAHGFELLLAAALWAPAQSAPPQTSIGVSGVLLAGAARAAAADRKPIDEQIEVMRALLLRKLNVGAGGVYSWGRDGTSSTNQPAMESGMLAYGSLAANLSGQRYYGLGRVHSVEGVYLDGYGVVLNVGMPPQSRDPRPGAEPPKTAPAMSDWDRMQRQLRGEKLPDIAAPVAKEPPLGDLVLKLLSQNGKNLKALKDDDKVTIAFTFRSEGPGDYRSTVSNVTSTPSFTPAIRVVPLQSTPASGPQRGQSARDLELLGELHLKQGQTEQALDAFRRALAVVDKEANESGREDADADKIAKRRAELNAKLAQAFIAAGKFDQAREALERAHDAGRKNPPPGKPATAKSSAMALPARLTITASKRMLDQVGSGSMSYDEFRKAATVEYTPAGRAAAE